ncbi:TolC family protein [Gemmata sp.]|uniref:TolC family protein n=1 Tax=Gemmata sp. TaxID=1914242 RepID=UPI003F7098E0
MARFGVLLMVGLLAGCCALPQASPPRPAPAQLPVVPRGTVQPDVSAANLAPAALSPARPAKYRQLTAAECRALAVQNAALADDLDNHPDNETPHSHPTRKRAQEAQTSKWVRGYAADEIRNRSAGDALEAYFKLAAAEGQFDLVAGAHAVLRTQLLAAEKAIKVGAADRADVERLRRQLLELESQLAKLEAGIAGLNAGLAGLLGLDPSDQTPIWPADPLRVAADVPDPEHAVQVAMRCRPDLNLLRVLSASDNYGGQMAKAVVTGINPLLGSTAPSNPMLAPVVALLGAMKKEPTKADAKLQREVEAALAARERQAESEVRAAVAMVRGNRLAVAAKAAEVRNHEARVAEAEKRVAAGVAGAQAELTVARLDLFKARGDLLQAVTDYLTSDAKLRQATGTLVRE